MTTLKNITTLLDHSDDLPYTFTDDTITINLSLFQIIIKVNPDDSITVNDEMTYHNLDIFTTNFFHDYI